MKTLVCSGQYLKPEDIERMKELGLEVTCHPNERAPVDRPEDYEAVICAVLFRFTPIERFTKLRFIQLISAGFDFLPLPYVEEKGIAWFRAENVHGSPMAEHTVGAVLDLYRKRRFYDAAQREHRWERSTDIPELSGRKICIVGAGQVGTECAMRFRAFGCEVVGIARSPGDRPGFDAVYDLSELNALLPSCDVAVVTLPAAPETKHLFGSDRFFLMKDGAVFVNIGRGSVVDEAALIEVLKSGKLMGAALDVFEREPLPKDSPLWDMENVILTPHNSAAGDLKSGRFMQCLERNLKTFRLRDPS
jgi:phosphoglycerate dehydrogenase-like enzyme